MRDEADVRVAFRIREVAEMLGLSVDTIEREVASRRLRAKKVRGVRLVLASDLQEWVRSFPDAIPPVEERPARRGDVVELDRARQVRDLAARRA